MAVNVDEGRLARLFVNDVVVPDLFVESFGGHGFTVRILALQENQGKSGSRQSGPMLLGLPWASFGVLEAVRSN